MGILLVVLRLLLKGRLKMLKGKSRILWDKTEIDYLRKKLPLISRIEIYNRFCRRFPDTPRTLSSVNHKIDQLLKEPKSSDT